MRTSTACLECRSRRRKCIFQPQQIVCTYCQTKHLSCSGPRLERRSTRPNDLAPHPPTATSSSQNEVQTHTTLLDLPLILELVELYFDLIHDQFHTLFHRPSFTARVANNEAPLVILYAMLALSARFSTNIAFNHSSLWDRSSFYAKESARLLDLRDISLSTIQACILLGTVSRSEGDGAAESVYYSIASRMANLLDLARMKADNMVEREVNLRVWWTLWRIDTWSSAGVNLPRQMIENEQLPLPMNETLFLSWTPSTSHSEISIPSDRTSSLFAQMIILNRIFIEINDFHTSLLKSPSTSRHQIETTICNLANKLDTWHSSLPLSMRNTEENLRRYGREGLGRIFVAVYLGYYHFGQLLYYPSLALLSTTHPLAQKCLSYSTSLCNLIHTAYSTPGCRVLYTMVGHNLVIASTIQIHTLLFSPSSPQITLSKSLLNRNFEILLELRNYWPVLEISFEAFRRFREACRRDMEGAFEMDAWMVGFLYGFANEVGDKEVFERAVGGGTVGSIGFGEWLEGT